MNDAEVVDSLTALAHPLRLQVFRALVVTGQPGLTPAVMQEALGVPATTLSFHLKELAVAGLVTQQRSGPLSQRLMPFSVDHPNAVWRASPDWSIRRRSRWTRVGRMNSSAIRSHGRSTCGALALCALATIALLLSILETTTCIWAMMFAAAVVAVFCLKAKLRPSRLASISVCFGTWSLRSSALTSGPALSFQVRTQWQPFSAKVNAPTALISTHSFIEIHGEAA
jgi:DNA-binding transcriptional ArsR family regulator